MALEKLTQDVANISKLDNYPPDDPGMTPDKLKQLFDKGSVTIKDYINNVLIPQLEAGYIDSIARTSGDGSPDSTDTYTITFHDGSTKTFQIYNGRDGIDGEKGDKGDTGAGLEFDWNGTQLGVRVEGQEDYVYVNLKGEKGDTGIGIASVNLVSGSHAAGTFDTYRITLYSARHSYDAPPNNANVWSNYNEYDAEAGFLYNFEEAFRNAILDTTIRVVKSSVDGGGYEDITRKVYLLSNTEVGLSNENGVAEDSKWDLFSDDNSRKAYPTVEAVSRSEYTNSDLNASSPWYWWLRTPYAGTSSDARGVYTDGALSNSNAYYGAGGVRPALELDSGILVSDTTDSDGCYTIGGTAQPLSNLPVGAKVKSPDAKYNGAPIIWLIGHKTANRVKLITEKIITLKCFDAKEPSNPNSDRQNYGNNRYSQSNIDQWLNSAATGNTTYDFQVYNGADGDGAGDMRKALYDTDNDGKVDAAEVADYADEAGHAGIADSATSAGYATTAGTADSATSASKLTTARKIEGVTFDGTQDISLPAATTSAKGLMSAADKTKLNYLSNKNLLHNWDFRNPVIQRGLSVYTEEGYTIDRWKLIHDGGTMTVAWFSLDNGYISLLKESAGFSAWIQPIEPSMIPLLRGREVTLSVWIYGQASPVSLTLTVPPSGAIDTENFNLGSGFFFNLLGDDGNTFLWFRIYNNTTTDGLSFYAVKLELGSVSTLANDPPADYGEQIALCKRYFRLWKTEEARTTALQEVGLMRLENPTLGTINIGDTTYYYASADL